MEMSAAWVSYATVIMMWLVLAWLLHIVMRDEKNPIEWWHFISSKGQDGQQYADMTKLGQAIGIFLCVSVTFIFAVRKDIDPASFSILLGVVLVYLGGVQAYQTYTKSKNGMPHHEKPKEDGQ